MSLVSFDGILIFDFIYEDILRENDSSYCPKLIWKKILKFYQIEIF